MWVANRVHHEAHSLGRLDQTGDISLVSGGLELESRLSMSSAPMDPVCTKRGVTVMSTRSSVIFLASLTRASWVSSQNATEEAK